MQTVRLKRRACLWCGEKFAARPRQRFCVPSHGVRASEAGAKGLPKRKRRPRPRKCVWRRCGRAFVPHAGRQRYCRPSHRQRDYEWRRNQERLLRAASAAAADGDWHAAMRADMHMLTLKEESRRQAVEAAVKAAQEPKLPALNVLDRVGAPEPSWDERDPHETGH